MISPTEAAKGTKIEDDGLEGEARRQGRSLLDDRKWTQPLAMWGAVGRAFQGCRHCKALRERRAWWVASLKEQPPENCELDEGLGGEAREPR